MGPISLYDKVVYEWLKKSRAFILFIWGGGQDNLPKTKNEKSFFFANLSFLRIVFMSLGFIPKYFKEMCGFSKNVISFFKIKI